MNAMLWVTCLQKPGSCNFSFSFQSHFQSSDLGLVCTPSSWICGFSLGEFFWGFRLKLPLDEPRFWKPRQSLFSLAAFPLRSTKLHQREVPLTCPLRDISAVGMLCQAFDFAQETLRCKATESSRVKLAPRKPSEYVVDVVELWPKLPHFRLQTQRFSS